MYFKLKFVSIHKHHVGGESTLKIFYFRFSVVCIQPEFIRLTCLDVALMSNAEKMCGMSIHSLHIHRQLLSCCQSKPYNPKFI